MSHDYPSDWDSRRKRVYKRDDYTCQNCGIKGGSKGDAELHAHHIVPKAKGGTHKLTNLKTVCNQCHNAIHGNGTARPVGSSSDQNSAFADFALLTGAAIFFAIGLVVILPITNVMGAVPSIIRPIFALFLLAFWFGVPILITGLIGQLN